MNETVIETKRIRVLERKLSDIECQLQDNEMKSTDRIVFEGCHRNLSDDLEQARKDAAVFLERDHMPVQVAREMLLVSAGQGRMTARQRKTYQQAREKHYVSQNSRTPGEYKVARKFSEASLRQIGQWLKRAQHLKINLEKQTKKPALLAMKEHQKEALLKLILAKLMAVCTTIEMLTDEISRRDGKQIEVASRRAAKLHAQLALVS